MGTTHADTRVARSTKAGTVVPATPVAKRAIHRYAVRSTKAGTVVPATPVGGLDTLHVDQPRSTKAGTVVPATPTDGQVPAADGSGALNEGRDRSPGDTRGAKTARRHGGGARSTKAGTVVPATPEQGSPLAYGGPDPLNEGRDRSPGDTRIAPHNGIRVRHRSTKAGTVVPATQAQTARWVGQYPRPLNEGRDRSPGDTQVEVNRRNERLCDAQRRPGP